MLLQKLGKRDDLFFINASNIENVSIYRKSEKYDENMEINKDNTFILEKCTENEQTKYIIKYYNKGKADDIGILELANPLEK